MFSDTFSVTFKLTCICLNQEQQQWFPVSIQSGAWKCYNNVGYANVITTVNWSQSSGYNILWRYIPSVNYAQLSSSINIQTNSAKYLIPIFNWHPNKCKLHFLGVNWRWKLGIFFLSNTANVFIQQKCNICFIFFIIVIANLCVFLIGSRQQWAWMIAFTLWILYLH